MADLIYPMTNLLTHFATDSVFSELFKNGLFEGLIALAHILAEDGIAFAVYKNVGGYEFDAKLVGHSVVL